MILDKVDFVYRHKMVKTAPENGKNSKSLAINSVIITYHISKPEDNV